MVTVEAELCKGCNLCVEACPKKVFSKSKKQNSSGYYVPTVTNPGSCTSCGLCELQCPDFAISIEKIKTEKTPTGKIKPGKTTGLGK